MCRKEQMEYTQYAMYVRASSEEQTDQHQFDDIRNWCADKEIQFNKIKKYVDYAQSGASGKREEFLDLIEDVENNQIENVVVWEISRVARRGSLSQRFFDACEDAGTTVHIVNGSIEVIKPDGTNRLVADIIASVAAEERRSLIRRTKSGIQRAKKEGKWTGAVPTGFIRTDGGFLKPNLSPSSDEVGYIEMVDALQKIENGEGTYKGEARSMACTRQTLMQALKERRNWYLPSEEPPDDERVEEAIDEIKQEVHSQ